MTRIHREIILKAGCNALDLTITDPKKIKLDLARRLKRLEKDLAKAIEKGRGQEVISIIERSITCIKKTLEVMDD